MIRGAFVFLLSAGLLGAQLNANKSAITGTVTDSTGAPIAGARIVIASAANGSTRETQANNSGTYAVNALDPGTYSVTALVSNFSASVQRIVLNVGDTLQVNISLSIGTTVQSVDLSASSSATAQPETTELFDQRLIDHLPIDGRRFQDFATLAPEVLDAPQTRNQLSFAGQRGIYSNVMLDGGDYNEPFLGGIRGGDRSSLAFTVPQSAIEEFQVVESGYGNEYGRSTGGILNVVTRSGSNDLHGQAFYQLRPSGLSQSDPYGSSVLDNQHQFGASAGGPIRRDKLFYFGAAEVQLARFPRNVRFSALDPFAANLTPAIAPAYNYLRGLEGRFDDTNNIGAGFARVDYQLTGGSRLAFRYNHSQNQADNAISPDITTQSQTTTAFSANGSFYDYTDSAGVQYTAILPAFVNDLRLEYSKERVRRTANSASPFVQAGPIGNFGANPDLPGSYGDYRVQSSDTASLVRGRHSLSLGWDYSFIQASLRSGANQFGAFDINSTDALQTLQILSGVAVNRFDDPSVSYLRQVGNLQQSSNAHQLAFFAQDSWRVNRSLTLEYGLRWEAQLNPSPAVDNSFLVNNVLHYPFPLGQVDPTAIRSQWNQWAPRVAFAWSPNGSGTTVLRAMAGLFYGQTPLAWYAGPLTNFSSTPSDLTLLIGPASGGTVYQQFLAGGFNLNQQSLNNLPVMSVNDVWINVAGKPNPFAQANVITTSGNNFRNPRSAQLSLLAQRQLIPNLFISYQLDHVNTDHLERNVDYNVPAPFVRSGDLSLRPIFGLRSGTSRPNPNLGAVLVRDSSARSNYLANTFKVAYRAKRLQFSAHYTLSYNKSDDDNERQVNEISYQNPFDFSRDFNWSNLDARHQVAGDATAHLIGGIDASALFHYRSGLPIDAITGADTSELLTPNFGNRPLVQPGVFMLRNSFRNLDFKSLDLRLEKSFPVKDKLRLQLFGDLFNLANWRNLAFIPSILFPSNPAFIYGPGVLPDGRLAPIAPGFLKSQNTSGAANPATTYQQGTPLELQLGLRFFF